MTVEIGSKYPFESWLGRMEMQELVWGMQACPDSLEMYRSRNCSSDMLVDVNCVVDEDVECEKVVWSRRWMVYVVGWTGLHSRI